MADLHSDSEKGVVFWLLGAPRIHRWGEPLAVPRRQVRALLYRLALARHPVSRDELAELLCAGQPERQARRALSRLIAYARQVLAGTEILQTTPEMVSLNSQQTWCDAAALLSLDAANDPDDALETGVNWVTGPFLHGFSLPDNVVFDDWVSLTQQEIERHYLTLLAALVERKTAGGQHQAAIQYARQYLYTDELAEEMHRQLIRLYTLIGDRGAAQRQYEQCLTTLERELGVAPLPETQAAYRAAITQQIQVAPLAERPLWNLLPSLDAPMVGREEAWKQLQATVEALAQGSLVFITGESGIGKTRLMQALTEDTSALVLAGSAYPGTRDLPYAPLSQAFHMLTQHPDLLQSVPVIHLSEALPLLPELRQIFPDLPPSPARNGGQFQALAYEAVAQMLFAIAKRRAVWLCLDDLHWADRATLAWLSYLLGRLPGHRLLILATVRAESLEAVADVRRQAERAGVFRQIALGPLAKEAIIAILQQLALPLESEAIIAFAHRLYQATGGNPFFALETLRALLESGDLDTSFDTLPVPTTIRHVIATRLERLSALARQVLEAAAVLETNTTLPLLAAVSGRQDEEVAEALEELVRHQFLHSQQERLTFNHALTRSVLAEQLTPWRQQILHRRAAAAIETQAIPDPAGAAIHWEAAAEWERAALACAQASQRFTQRHMYDVALELAERGFRLLRRVRDQAPARLRLLCSRLPIYQALLRVADWEADLQAVEELAPLLQDDAAALQALESRLSLLAFRSGLPALQPVAEKGLALARRLRDHRAEVRILYTLGHHLAEVVARPEEALPHLQEAARLAGLIGDEYDQYRVFCDLAYCLRLLGKCQAALAYIRRALALMPGTPEPHPLRADALQELASINTYLARWQEARAILQQAISLHEAMQTPWSLGADLYNLGLLSSAMGRHQEAIAAMERLVQIGLEAGLPPVSEFGLLHRAGLVWTLVHAGQIARAGALYEQLSPAENVSGRARLDYAIAGGALAMATGQWAQALARLQDAVEMVQQQHLLHLANPLLLYAQAAHHLGKTEAALEALQLAEARARDGDYAYDACLRHFVRYQITGQVHVLAEAEAEMMRQANLFTDPTLQRDFLQNLPLNRLIQAAWKNR